MPALAPSKYRQTHDELKKLSTENLLDMLFERESPEGIRAKQAAYELARRQEVHRIRLQLFFAGVSAIAAVAAAVTAAITAFCR